MQTFEAQQAGKERIAKAVANLALARQAPDFADAAQRVYVHLLSDLDAAYVARACEAFARQPREAYTSAMPSTGDLRSKVSTLVREDAEAEKRAKVLQLPARESDEPRYFCTSCQDEPSAWQICWCPGDGAARQIDPPARAISTRIAPCGRTGRSGVPHQPHTYTERCACSDTNPVIAEHRRRQKEFRQQRAAK